MDRKSILDITSQVNNLKNEFNSHRKQSMPDMLEDAKYAGEQREMSTVETMVSDVIRSHQSVYSSIAQIAKRMRFSEEEGTALKHASSQIPEILRLIEMMPGSAEVVAEIEKEVKEQMNRDKANYVVDR